MRDLWLRNLQDGVGGPQEVLRSIYAAAEAALAKNPGSLPELTESAKAVLATLSAMP